jgi:hypothetical protein
MPLDKDKAKWASGTRRVWPPIPASLEGGDPAVSAADVVAGDVGDDLRGTR